MSKVSVFDQKWLDLVFEGRNKSYGAYQLRQQDPKTTLIALFSGIALLGALVSIPVIINILKPEMADNLPAPTLPPTEIIKEIELIEKPKPVNKETAAPAPKPKESTRELKTFVATTEPIEKDPPQTRDFVDTNPGNTTTQGSDGGIDLGPTSPNGPVEGTGTGTTDGDSGDNTPAIPGTLDKDPSFPGGIQNFKNAVVQKFNMPDIQRELTVKVYVSFIVEKDGSMSEIKVANDPGYELGKEALKALKSIKTKWSPGMRKGKPVRTAYSLPIVVKVN